MLHRRLVSLFAGMLAAFGLVAGHGSVAGCGGKNPDACGPYDGGFPNVDAGESCSFPCPVAAPGDDAGGDDYATFASGFFGTYCVRCHATTRTDNCQTAGSATCRFGSPPTYNWDDPSSIAAHLPQIRAVVAVGVPLSMPPDLPSVPDAARPAPTCSDRFRIARWIDSGAAGLP